MIKFQATLTSTAHRPPTKPCYVETEGGQFLAQFNSRKEAADALGINPAYVSLLLTSRTDRELVDDTYGVLKLKDGVRIKPPKKKTAKKRKPDLLDRVYTAKPADPTLWPFPTASRP